MSQELLPTGYDRYLLTSANLLIETNTQANRHILIPPQHDRLFSQIETFRSIESRYKQPSATSIIGLQELQIYDGNNNGEDIKKALGHKYGQWHPHSRHSVGEHIGAISSTHPDSSEAIHIDKNRLALVLRFGKFCVCVAHPMYSDAKRRASQLDALGEYLADEEYVALLADFNEEPLPFSRRKKLGSIGLQSAFKRIGQGHPVTLPTPHYKKFRSLPRRLGYEVLAGGLCYDDIYISDSVRVQAAGTATSDSDHRFIYAAVAVPTFT